MSRIWCGLLLFCLARLSWAAEEATPPPAQRSPVWFVHEPAAITRFATDDRLVKRMVDSLVVSVTGKPDVADAWRSLVAPGDVIGIKVDARGGRDFSSHPAVVNAIVAGLVAAGHPAKSIVIWDRNADDLTSAGFVETRSGPRVRAIEPIVGYDPQAIASAPVSGKLIWGDVDFRGKAAPARGALVTEEADQLSAISHWSRLLGAVTKIINVATLTDSTQCGIAGCLYNVTVPNVDNWRRFTQAPDYICDLYTDPRLAPKVALQIMDGLIGQYAGGPGRQPGYSVHHATLYAGHDPVAIDATALRLIEQWRKEVELPPIGPRADYLKTAESLGIGHAEASEIDLRQVSLR